MINLRVIGGTARGIRLKAVPGDITRPIMDRVKESLFNIIGADIEGSTFWDMFGGTGSVAIEAISRGARSAWITDLNNAPIQTIKENLDRTHFSERVKVTRGDVLKIIRQADPEPFEYLYVAPPQYHSIWLTCLKQLDEFPAWLSEDGWIIVQIDPKEYENISLRSFSEFDRRRYGNTVLVFYSRKENTTQLFSN